MFAKFGFDEGVAGHITVRDPEYPDSFWVNPFGVHFGQVCASNLIRCDHNGVVLEGDYPLNQAAFSIHSCIHKHRPDALAAAHAHSKFGKAWSSFGRLLQPLNQDSCAFFEDHSVYEGYGGVAFDLSEGENIAKALSTHKALILQNHGLLTVGKSVGIYIFRIYVHLSTLAN